MIRVGFVLDFAGNAWLGGTSYYRNLFAALHDLPGRRIDPVLIASRRSFDVLSNAFPGRTIMRLPLLDAPPFIGQARRVTRSLWGRDPAMERALRSRDISIVSHSGYLGSQSRVPSIVWIPDFQELAFPEFFSRRELASRHRNAVKCCRHASTVLLSSGAALSDLKSICPGDVRTEVLRFVATVPSANDSTPRHELMKKYGLADRFLHLPNQFWAHKNHELVLHALALLRQQGCEYQVVATGNPADPRQPQHFSSLMAKAGQLGVDDLFKPLGVVPYADLMGLMRHAVAVINPSKFEGWSTTVEEAKSMGKAILLSDIPVHLEQAPDRAAFFPPDDATALAESMRMSVTNWSIDDDARHMASAASDLPGRREAFARRYEDIVLATLAKHKVA